MRKLCFLILFFSALCACSQIGIQNVDAITFKTELQKEGVILIDLRTDAELAKKGWIKGAKQIDFFNKDAEKEILALDKDKTYLIYCAGGGRSSECADLMQKNGFLKIIHLEKGFDDWKQKGFEIEKN